jgi:hypothetical protein
MDRRSRFRLGGEQNKNPFGHQRAKVRLPVPAGSRVLIPRHVVLLLPQ